MGCNIWFFSCWIN